MAPFGDYKGASIALIVDILAVGMTGSSFTFQASTTTDLGDPPNLGQFFMTMNPSAFGGADFGARLETLFTAMLSQEGVRLPGDRRLANRLQTREAGVAISDDLHQRLLAYCS